MESGLQPTLTIKQSYEYLNIGRTRLFALIKSGELKSYKNGKSRRIKREWLLEYEQQLIAGSESVSAV